MMLGNIKINPELLEFYAFYVGILCLKYFLMILHVGLGRMYYHVPVNQEDAKYWGSKVHVNENVERLRRAHQNDLENLPFFIITCFVFLWTDPSVFITQWIIRIYVFSRILYTFIYTQMQSPLRSLVYEIGTLINWYLSGSIIYHFGCKS